MIKKIIFILILINSLFATGNCPENQKVCAYFYKGGLSREIKVQNMTSKPIVINLFAYIGLFYKDVTISNMKIGAYSNITAISKFYQNLNDAKRDNYDFYYANLSYKKYKKNMNCNKYKIEHKIIGNGQHKIRISKQILKY
ncbi:hypothetical protein ACKGJI_04625 [Sulfurospirillum sp. 1307]